MFSHHPIRQIAFFVPDVKIAARRHAAMFGSGPYYVAEHIPLTVCEYRGQAAELDHSSAYGQWGEVMVEMVQQNNPGPSVFRDMYPDGGQGVHHVALIVDDIQAVMKDFNLAGYETALYAEVMPGAGFAMMDCVRDYGHFVELYEPSEALLGVYSLVRGAAENWDGSEIIRSFSLG
jgi:hypothetical protein